MVVVSVNVGEPAPHPATEGRQTGIYKVPVSSIDVLPLGVAGDHVLDRRHHGGPSKAVCCYSADRFEYWRQQYPQAEWVPGAFGVNLTVSGLDEDSVAIGDVFTIGTCTLQVSQPRGPCGTLAGRHGIADFAKVCSRSGFTGWYFRCLRPGTIAAGEPIVKVSSHPAAFTVAAANAVRYAKTPDVADIDELLAVDALSDAWRSDLAELRERALSGQPGA